MEHRGSVIRFPPIESEEQQPQDVIQGGEGDTDQIAIMNS